MKKIIFIFITLVTLSSYAQVEFNNKNYIGLMPSFLAEPYDTINALEVNLFPFVFEHKFENNLALQLRPIFNYRFYKLGNGFSQIGGTILLNKYMTNWVNDSSWVVPVFGIFNTTTYNRLDKISTITNGIEAGILMLMGKKISMALTLQPGVNYYPNEYSRNFVESESGFKNHFGVMFQVGYNF